MRFLEVLRLVVVSGATVAAVYQGNAFAAACLGAGTGIGFVLLVRPKE